MSNLKKHFFHISKSWFSVCTFIFLLAVCVGLVIHITNKKENATCSNSEAPIVSNGNVSEESGSDIAHAENYVPTEEDVLAARQQATEGMSQQQVERLTEVIKAANLWLEQRYMDENLFEKLSDPNSLYWNYFHQTGEIQIGWAVDGSIDIDAVCKREKLILPEDSQYTYAVSMEKENGYLLELYFTAVTDDGTYFLVTCCYNPIDTASRYATQTAVFSMETQ